MNKIRRVAIYLRVSTDEQAINGVSLDSQKEELLKFVNDRKVEYVINEEKHIFIDGGYSGASDDRPAFRRMMLSAKNKEFDIVIVWKIDRFFRKTLFLLQYVEKLFEYGVGFKSITQPFDTSDSYGKMVLGILGVIGELEREMIRERTAGGKIQKSKMGYFVGGGSSRYGFDIMKVDGGKKLEVNKDEKGVILRIFDMYVNGGKSIQSIADVLSNEKIPTKYDTEYKNRESYDKMKPCHWHQGTVRGILVDTMYIGKYYYGKTYKKINPETKKYETCYREKGDPLLIEMNCEKILEDESIFYKAQELLKKNMRILNNKVHKTHLFTGMIVCKSCGRHYIGYRTVKSTFSYRCGGCVGKKLPKELRCHNPEVSENFLINTIWGKINDLFSNPEKTLEDYFKNNNDNSKIIDGYREELKIISLGIDKNNYGLTQVYSEFYMEHDESIKIIKQGVIDGYKTKINNLNSRKEEILIKLAKYDRIDSSKKGVKEVVKKFKSNIKGIGSDEKKFELIRKFVDVILVRDDGSVVITYRFEDLGGGDKSKGGGKKGGGNGGYLGKGSVFTLNTDNIDDDTFKNLPLDKGRNEEVNSLDKNFDVSM